MALTRDLPEWLEQGTESSLRDTEDDVQPSGIVQVAALRSIASTSHGSTPIVLTPTGGHSPAATGNSPVPWTNLDQFYADVDEATESENGDDDGTDHDDDDGGASSGSERDAGSESADEETGTESEGSQGTSGDDSHGPA